ncbi:DNA helicase [Tanacetum coccineum]
MSAAFATNKASISNAWKRKSTYPSLIVREEEPLSSRNIIRRSTLSSSNAEYANERRNYHLSIIRTSAQNRHGSAINNVVTADVYFGTMNDLKAPITVGKPNAIYVVIPDHVEDARGYKLVTELMMHGPCGAANLGPDHILSKISNSEASTSAPGNRKQIYEIQNYVDVRFICIYEACWRIFDFPIHSREPAVQILSVYLENMQHVTFYERDRLDIIVNLPEKKRQPLSNGLSTIMKTPMSVPKLNHDQKKIYDLIIAISSLRSQGKIFLAVASSGIAFLLLLAGHTTHSRKIVVIGGDFCQTLLVKKGAEKEELIATSLTESYLWWHFKICTLKENMRLLRSDLINEERKHSEAFVKWILDVGNGLPQLTDFIYDDATLKTQTARTLQEKAIACPKNNMEDIVNAKILLNIQGKSRTYLSSDEAIPKGRETSETDLLYLMKYLNTITFLGFLPHELELKVGSPIMLLQNVNLSGGLCNDTRMIVRTLMSKLIEAQIITGTRVSEKVFKHRIPLTHKDPNLSFTFKRT